LKIKNIGGVAYTNICDGGRGQKQYVTLRRGKHNAIKWGKNGIILVFQI
jgi:hypothetical protein